MKAGLAAAAVILLGLATPVFAHRLDEYLQATTIDVGRSRVVVQVRLTPGVEVVRDVLASIDANGDGILSQIEQRTYADRVLRDLSLAVDAKPVQLRLVSSEFPSIERMKEGLGDIEIELDAPVPDGGRDRRLVFENHHQSRISAYLVNCLIPSDPEIHVKTQSRERDQSRYQLDYTQVQVEPSRHPTASWSTLPFWLGANALVLFVWLATLLRRRSRRLP